MTTELVHWGVLGMKWGRRNIKTRPISGGKKTVLLKKILLSGVDSKIMTGKWIYNGQKVSDIRPEKISRAKQITKTILLSGMASKVYTGKWIYRDQYHDVPVDNSRHDPKSKNKQTVPQKKGSELFETTKADRAFNKRMEQINRSKMSEKEKTDAVRLELALYMTGQGGYSHV